MKFTQQKNAMIRLLVLLMVFTCSVSSVSYAGMISTDAVIDQNRQSYDKQELLTLLQSQELKEQLQQQGVTAEMVEQRIASMTPAEIEALNLQLEDAPAGGIIGALVTIFVVLVITDLLCATDVFAFVRCINK